MVIYKTNSGTWLQRTVSQTESLLQDITRPVSLLYPLKSNFEDKYPSTSDPESVMIEETLKHLRELDAQIEALPKVRNYLYRYPDIAKLSHSVSDLVYQYFDLNARLFVEIQDDEIPESEYLAMYVRVPEYDDSVLDRIREIRGEYGPLLANKIGWFLLTTDYRSPARTNNDI